MEVIISILIIYIAVIIHHHHHHHCYHQIFVNCHYHHGDQVRRCPGALVALQEALLDLDPLFLVLEDQLLMVDLFLDLSTVGCQVLSCILSKIYNSEQKSLL